MTEHDTSAMHESSTEHVTVTLTRDDWHRIIRLVDSTVPAAEESVENAYDLDDGEKPDDVWIEGREHALTEARAFAERVHASAGGTATSQA